MQIQTGLMFILMLCVFPLQANATIYGWQGDGGVLNLSNDPEQVPDTETAQKYTSRFAKNSAKKAATTDNEAETASTPSTASTDLASTDLVTAEVERLRAYERGLEQGLATAERQVQMAGELARTVLSAVPPVQPQAPVHIVFQQAAPVVRHSSPIHTGQYSPFYGFIGPYAPHSYFGGHAGYSYGFQQGRFPRHSHFYPGRRGGRRGIFFPRGHFSQDGFLFGHGIVVR